MRTIKQIKEWMAEQLHEDELDTVLSTTLIPRWVTQVRDKIISFHTWRWNEGVRQLTWPTVGAGQDASILYLPHTIDRIKTVYPGTNSTRPVRIMTATEVDSWRPVSGVIPGEDILVLHGWYGVRADMPAAGVVTMTPAGWVAGNMTALVEGRSVAGEEQTEEITSVGGAVAVGALTFAAGVEGVRKITLIGTGTGYPLETAGVITFTSGGVTLQILNSAREMGREHRRTEFYGVGTAGGTYTVRYWRKHQALTRDRDVCDLPEEFHDLLETGLLMKLARFRKQADEYQVAKDDYAQRMIELIAWDYREPGMKVTMKVKRQWP